MKFLEELSIVVTPGNGFGPNGEGYFRISLTMPDARIEEAVARIASGDEPPVPYDQDEHTGDFWPRTSGAPWSSPGRHLGASCARG